MATFTLAVWKRKTPFFGRFANYNTLMPELDPATPIRGRGSSFNPSNRFQDRAVSREEDFDEPVENPSTTFITDHSKSIISWNKSPDIPFDAGINPYRGCEHGCVYCYARQTHEYLGYSSGLDFETKIVVKKNAAELLEKEL
ncbi:MAG: hypothetical protein JNM63_00025, partial [Spirochaetia bacterium]|nr:hypothetical protein [Spirochaetia bacterium]